MAGLKHLDGCPASKDRTEKYTRSFVRGGARMETKVTRCMDCGSSDSAKPKKVEE